MCTIKQDDTNVDNNSIRIEEIREAQTIGWLSTNVQELPFSQWPQGNQSLFYMMHSLDLNNFVLKELEKISYNGVQHPASPPAKVPLGC
jgi:hypothetical protein